MSELSIAAMHDWDNAIDINERKSICRLARDQKKVNLSLINIVRIFQDELKGRHPFTIQARARLIVNLALEECEDILISYENKSKSLSSTKIALSMRLRYPYREQVKKARRFKSGIGSW